MIEQRPFSDADAPHPETPPAAAKPPSGPPRPGVKEWILTIVIAFGVALFIRGFLFEAFRIPTSSMEKNLLVGDFVLVNKLYYGARTPMTVGVPFTNLFARALQLPYHRLPGFGDVRRGDVIVFNYPLERKPIDRKTHYIKRVVGLPGDTLSIANKVPVVNGMGVPMNEGMQQRWVAHTREELAVRPERLRAYGAAQVTLMGREGRRVLFESTAAVARTVSAFDEVESVEPLVDEEALRFDLQSFPPGRGFGRDNYGPLFVPARGAEITLDENAWAAYRDVITNREGHTAFPLGDGTFMIDGERTTTYTFEQDYFFVMGDNRDSSYDSRIWGFVPMDHVVGRAIVVYFSWDALAGRPRLDRLFSAIR